VPSFMSASVFVSAFCACLCANLAFLEYTQEGKDHPSLDDLPVDSEAKILEEQQVRDLQELTTLSCGICMRIHTAC